MNVSNTVYPFVSNRIERTYAFTRTGDAFSTTLRVAATELVGLNEVNLILSEAEAFSSSELLQVYPMILVGENYEVTLSIPASGVFTIGETPVLNVNENSLSQVSIFPVPSYDVLNVNVGHEILNATSYRVFSVEGKQVLTGGVYSAKQQLDISNLPSGVYVLQVQDSGSLVKREFVKL
jgi:hypothetical protein